MSHAMPPRLPKSKRFLHTGLLAAGAFVLGGLVLPNIHVTWREPNSAAQTAGLGVVPGPPAKELGPEEAYARAARVASPAVVNIDTTQNVRVTPSLFDDDWVDTPRFRQARSEGSGVIINATGDILTNEHVVGAVGETNKTIQITLMDGRHFTGSVIGSDHVTDVALVHISGNNLPVARLGTMRGLTPGQMAIAIGNPYGFRFTVTHGVISALDRPIPEQNEGRVYEKLIQTDCAINPGNSGGPLCTMDGRIVGINTVVLSQAQGIGFAIPIDTALSVADQLKRYGHVKRPWLGVVALTNTAAIAERYGLSTAQGAIVNVIYRDGPAVNTELQRGDVITSLNGQPVRSEEDFKNIEKSLKIGQEVTLTTARAGQVGKGKIVVGEAP